MKVDRMRAALKAFGALMGGAEAVALTKFAKLFEGMGDVTAASVVAQVSKNWTAEKRPKTRPADLERAIRRIRDTLTATGATTQASVFGKTLALVEGTGNQDLDSFVAEAIAARVKRAPAKKPPKPKKPKFAEAQAPDLGRRLAAAAHQRARFDALLNEYETDYKPAELKAIAHCFMGYEVNKTKKADIIKAIRNWQREAELNDDLHAAQARQPV
jgi:DNA-binding ferritin-like protein (Dps family)